MKFTYYGHSCFAVETGGKRLVFDPFVTPNELARSIDLGAIAANYLFVSHGHFDHIADTVSLAERTGATVIANFEVAGWLEKQGVRKTHPMNLGGAYAFDFGRVKYVPALHSSSLPDGSYGGNPGGFVVTTTDGAFYYSGDSALTLDMRLIPEETLLRLAVLPIGDNFTMGASDAARAAKLLQCPEVVGVHYDTFPPIRIDHKAAKRIFSESGLRLHLPAIGETIDL